MCLLYLFDDISSKSCPRERRVSSAVQHHQDRAVDVSGVAVAVHVEAVVDIQSDEILGGEELQWKGKNTLFSNQV